MSPTGRAPGPGKTRNFRNARRRKSYRGRTALVDPYYRVSLSRAREERREISREAERKDSLSREDPRIILSEVLARSRRPSLFSGGRTIISIVSSSVKAAAEETSATRRQTRRANNLLRRVRRSGLELISAG